MKVLIFGATGMVGQAALRECLAADDVELVQTVGRVPTGRKHPKLRDMIHAQMNDFGGREEELSGFDAAFFCIGVTSSRMSEQAYSHLTYDLTLRRHPCWRSTIPAWSSCTCRGRVPTAAKPARPCGNGCAARPKTPCCACRSGECTFCGPA